ncbi:MAG: acyltransferase domain-containing protein [Haloechinothrix sp.]
MDSSTAGAAHAVTAVPAGAVPERVLLTTAGTVAELDARLAAVTMASAPARQRLAEETGLRIGVVNPTEERVALARKIVAKGKPWRGRRDIWFAPEPLLAGGGGLAFVFPGLEADFAPRVDDVAELLGVPAPGLSTQTVGRHAAAVFAVGGLLESALRRLAIRPDAVAGHSAGEWQAMIAGGIVERADFDDMVARADLDALRVPGVEFAVLGCSPERVADEVTACEGMVISHENSPSQTVVCGPAGSVGELIQRMRSRGVICQVLPFRSGFHTPMLGPYLGPFTTSGLPSLPMRPASVPVWSATTARPFPADPVAIRELSLRHLLEPVRFRALVRALYESGIRVFVQSGPGQLGSLIDDTLRESDHLTVAANSAHRSGIEQLRRVATAVWVEGGYPDFTILDPVTPARVRHRRPRQPAEPERATGAPSPETGALVRLRDLGARNPLVAELNALFEDTAAAVAEVIDAAGRQPQEPEQTVAPPVASETALKVSTTAMPYLLDHCMAAQREGWPDETDRRPVVPATTMIAHMVAAALASAPGTVATEVTDIRFRRWLVVAPPERVDIAVRPHDNNRVSVRIGEHADAIVILEPNFGCAGPAPWQPSRNARTPAITARGLYDDRWMFHGPRFQGITRLAGISDEEIRGEITIPDPPGALLDNLGQLIGQWLVENHPERSVAFPAKIERIIFHEAEPPVGTTVDAAVRITSISEDRVTVDGQVSVRGRTLISVTGWHDYLVEGDQTVCAVHRFPERSTLSQAQQGDWWLLADPWTSLASREFYLRKYLGAAERDDYQNCSPPERRRWLLGRIVVKDAVRAWLWDRGFGPIFPAELQVWQDGFGAYRVTGMYGFSFPALDIAVAQAHELSVALIRSGTGQHPCAIEVAEVIEASLLVHNDLTRHDEAMLDRLRSGTGDALPVALSRLATARAVAATVAQGGRPTIRTVDGGSFSVTVDSESGSTVRYQVETATIRDPDGSPPRQYVVGWIR